MLVLFLLLVTILLISEVTKVGGGRQAGGIAKGPGLGLIETSIQRVKKRDNVFIEPEYGAPHCVKHFLCINS